MKVNHRIRPVVVGLAAASLVFINVARAEAPSAANTATNTVPAASTSQKGSSISDSEARKITEEWLKKEGINGGVYRVIPDTWYWDRFSTIPTTTAMVNYRDYTISTNPPLREMAVYIDNKTGEVIATVHVKNRHLH